MSITPDFKNLSAWENADPSIVKARIAIGFNENGYNLGALSVINKIFEIIHDRRERAQFFLICENLSLRSWKLWYAYAHFCQKDDSRFIQCVAKADEAMLKAVREKELIRNPPVKPS